MVNADSIGSTRAGASSIFSKTRSDAVGAGAR